MKTIVIATLTLPAAVLAQTATIDPVNKNSWQENCGWMNWRDANNAAQGVRNRATFLSGFIWGENIGWINLDLAAAGQFVRRSCYANCDNSTLPPALNTGDFTCFLQRYAAGERYANCDRGTVQPVINAGDFTCFLVHYAAGCP
jgi:hypothetical protein